MYKGVIIFHVTTSISYTYTFLMNSSFMYIKIPVHTFKNFLSFEIKYYSKLIYFLWGTG